MKMNDSLKKMGRNCLSSFPVFVINLQKVAITFALILVTEPLQYRAVIDGFSQFFFSGKSSSGKVRTSHTLYFMCVIISPPSLSLSKKKNRPRMRSISQ